MCLSIYRTFLWVQAAEWVRNLRPGHSLKDVDFHVMKLKSFGRLDSSSAAAPFKRIANLLEFESSKIIHLKCHV